MNITVVNKTLKDLVHKYKNFDDMFREWRDDYELTNIPRTNLTEQQLKDIEDWMEKHQDKHKNVKTLYRKMQSFSKAMEEADSKIIKRLFKQFVNENYRDNTNKLGEFLKQQFPDVKFIWDEDSKGWWTTDERFLNKYSSKRTSYNYNAEEELKRVFRSQNYGQKLIVNSDFDRIQLTLD